MKIRILLADDHRIVRDGLRNLLEKKCDADVIGEAETGRVAVQLARKLRPDVVLMDLAMPDLNGLEATRKIVTEAPEVKVVVLSMHADRRFVTGALSSGASGYLLKDCSFEELAVALRAVAAGQRYLSPAVAGVVIEHLGRTPNCSPCAVLTPREREILQLLAEGTTTKKIASKLNVSVKTVETHRHQIMQKLSVGSIAELTKYAIREGLTSL